MTGGSLGEDVHGQAFVLSTVLINCLLCNTDHLQLGHTGTDSLDNFFGSDVGNTVTFAQASQLVLTLDGAQLNHDVTGVHDLSFGESFADSVEDGDGGIQVGSNTDAQLLAGNTQGLEDIVEGVGLQLGVSGVGTLTVSDQGEDLVQLVAVSTEDRGLGAYQQSSIAVGCDSNTGALEQGPEAGEVTGIGVVSLVTVDDQNVQTVTNQNRSSALNSLFVLIIRDANSCHCMYLHEFFYFSANVCR